MNRGDLYWYAFSDPDKRRPVLIITRDSAIPYLQSLTIAPLTTTIRGIPSEVVLTADMDGVPEDCAVNCDNLQSISKRRFGRFIAHLSDARMNEVSDALRFALGIGSETSFADSSHGPSGV